MAPLPTDIFTGTWFNHEMERARQQATQAMRNEIFRQSGLSYQLAGLGGLAARQQEYRITGSGNEITYKKAEPQKPKTYREELQAEIDEWLRGEVKEVKRERV